MRLETLVKLAETARQWATDRDEKLLPEAWEALMHRVASAVNRNENFIHLYTEDIPIRQERLIEQLHHQGFTVSRQLITTSYMNPGVRTGPVLVIRW